MKITKTNRFVVTVTTSGEDWIGHFKEEPDIQEIEQAVFLDIKDLEDPRAAENEIERAQDLRIMLEVVRIADLGETDIYVGGTWVGGIIIKTEEIFGRVKESMPEYLPTSKPLNPYGEVVLDAADPNNDIPLVAIAVDEEDF